MCNLLMVPRKHYMHLDDITSLQDTNDWSASCSDQFPMQKSNFCHHPHFLLTGKTYKLTNEAVKHEIDAGLPGQSK